MQDETKNSGTAGRLRRIDDLKQQPISEAALDAQQEADAAVAHAAAESMPILELPRITALEAPGSEPKDVQPAEPAMQSAEPAVQSAKAATQTQESQLGEQAGELVLERKHPLAIRWMHWVNFPVLFTMIWSGLLIYWNDSDNAYKHPHAVYRVGLGSATLFRFFPAWVYTNHLWDLRYKVTTGLGYHFFFMWIFAINGILYGLYLLWSKEWKFMVPDRRSLIEAIQVTLFDLHLRKELPAQTKYNGAQRIAYSSTILMGFGALVTGLAIYKPTQTHLLTTLLGGYEMARWLHFLLTLGFCAFFLVHVVQVVMAGWNNFRSMVSGYELRRAAEPSLEAERRRF